MAMRLLKLIFVLTLGLWALFTMLGNLSGLPQSYAAVEAVTSMRELPPAMLAIPWHTTSPLVVWGGVLVIILGKSVAGILLLTGGWKMLRALGAPSDVFNAAKYWAIVGGWTNVLWLFIGFCFAGEIMFYMFMGEEGNRAAMTAFRYVGYTGLIMIFVNRDD